MREKHENKECEVCACDARYWFDTTNTPYTARREAYRADCTDASTFYLCDTCAECLAGEDVDFIKTIDPTTNAIIEIELAVYDCGCEACQ